MNQARIKLAEAMGWRGGGAIWSNALRWIKPGDTLPRYKEPPDPFTDANYDVAVLEWMLLPEQYVRFAHIINGKLRVTGQRDYKTGNYAREACKGLGIEVLA